MRAKALSWTPDRERPASICRCWVGVTTNTRPGAVSGRPHLEREARGPPRPAPPTPSRKVDPSMGHSAHLGLIPASPGDKTGSPGPQNPSSRPGGGPSARGRAAERSGETCGAPGKLRGQGASWRWGSGLGLRDRKVPVTSVRRPPPTIACQPVNTGTGPLAARGRLTPSPRTRPGGRRTTGSQWPGRGRKAQTAGVSPSQR